MSDVSFSGAPKVPGPLIGTRCLVCESDPTPVSTGFAWVPSSRDIVKAAQGSVAASAVRRAPYAIAVSRVDRVWASAEPTAISARNIAANAPTACRTFMGFILFDPLTSYNHSVEHALPSFRTKQNGHRTDIGHPPLLFLPRRKDELPPYVGSCRSGLGSIDMGLVILAIIR